MSSSAAMANARCRAQVRRSPADRADSALAAARRSHRGLAMTPGECRSTSLPDSITWLTALPSSASSSCTTCMADEHETQPGVGRDMGKQACGAPRRPQPRSRFLRRLFFRRCHGNDRAALQGRRQSTSRYTYALRRRPSCKDCRHQRTVRGLGVAALPATGLPQHGSLSKVDARAAPQGPSGRA